MPSSSGCPQPSRQASTQTPIFLPTASNISFLTSHAIIKIHGHAPKIKFNNPYLRNSASPCLVPQLCCCCEKPAKACLNPRPVTLILTTPALLPHALRRQTAAVLPLLQVVPCFSISAAANNLQQCQIFNPL